MPDSVPVPIPVISGLTAAGNATRKCEGVAFSLIASPTSGTVGSERPRPFLPVASSLPLTITITNGDGNSLLVYPPSGGTDQNGGSAGMRLSRSRLELLRLSRPIPGLDGAKSAVGSAPEL